MQILSAGEADSIAVLEHFEIAKERHPKFGMPVLTRRLGEVTYVILRTTVSDGVLWDVVRKLMKFEGYSVLD